MSEKIVVLMGALPYPRMYKRIQLESELGETHLICWDRGNNMLETPKGENYQVHLIKEAAVNDPLRRLIPYAKVFKKAYKILQEIKPKVIHVEGLDMLKIATKYKDKIDTSVKIIFEVGDLHRLIVDEQKNPIRKAARLYLRHEDKRLSKYYDLLIITSEAFYDVYFKDFVKKEKILYIPNAPEVSSLETYKKKNNGHFTIGYVGSIRYKEQIRMLIAAAEKCNINLVFAGFEQEPIEIEPLCQGKENITWLGRFDFKKEAAKIYGMCDAIYSVYDADMANVRVALPNKLYESVYCELPLIVAKNTYLAEKTEKWGVGVAVSHKNIKDLVEAINELQNEKVYSNVVENCKRAKGKLFDSNPNEVLTQKIMECIN